MLLKIMPYHVYNSPFKSKNSTGLCSSRSSGASLELQKYWNIVINIHEAKVKYVHCISVNIHDTVLIMIEGTEIPTIHI